MRSGALGVFGGFRYDMVRRRVWFVPDARAFRASLQYEFVVTTGLRAWDGAALATPVAVRFMPGATEPTPARTTPSLRRDVAPLLSARCATAGCHVGPDPVMGLDLSSPESIVRSAVRVPARQRPAPGPAAQSAGDPRWGAMVRIDPGLSDGQGRPEYSYVMYKILGDGPVIGTRMPSDGAALTPDEASQVAEWIRAGAPPD